MSANTAPLILLKVLEPLAEEPQGDLYFELHESKREVYIVTDIDPQAWPDGKGVVQMGFSQQKRAEFTNDDAFRLAYLASVEAYRQVRDRLDQHLERNELIDESLISAERRQRDAMNRFIAQHPLALGDVVTVPNLVPHSLRHGVSVVEFQSPVYERKILSSGQKVVTQDHWDTREALDLARLDLPLPAQPSLLQSGDGFTWEQIAQFEDFQVRRLVVLPSTESLILPICLDHYALIMLICGAVQWHNASDQLHTLAPGQAAMIPAAVDNLVLELSANTQILMAVPGVIALDSSTDKKEQA